MNGTYQSRTSDVEITDEDALEKAKGYKDEQRGEYYASDKSKVIDINNANFNYGAFGSFAGTNNADSKQNAYLNQIIRDAKAGLIEKGQLIIPNYGNRGSGRDTVYMYLGNGRFVKTYNTASTYQGWGKDIYVPNGYKENWLGNIKKE